MQTTSKNSSPTISCIYVNYHSVSLLEASLRSLFLYEKSSQEKEVLVVNNDPAEKATLTALASQYKITILDSGGNIGFAAAVNQGVVAAKGELLFFVNPDTQWHEPLFEKIVQHFKDPKTAILGVGLVSPQGALEQGNGGVFLSTRTFLRKVAGKTKTLPLNGEEVDWVSGGALACRKEVFNQLGGFDERFFMYFEDMDFCKRAKEEGFTVLLNQTFSLTHFRGKSHSSKKSQKRLYDTSLYLYIQKHWPPLFFPLFFTIHKIYRFFYPYGR